MEDSASSSDSAGKEGSETMSLEDQGVPTVEERRRRTLSAINARAPINRLPTETFVAILKLAGGVGTETLDQQIMFKTFNKRGRSKMWKWMGLSQERQNCLRRLSLVSSNDKLANSVLWRCRGLTHLSFTNISEQGLDWSILRSPCLSNLRWLELNNAHLDDPLDAAIPLSLRLDELVVHTPTPRSPQTYRFFTALFIGASATLRCIKVVQTYVEWNMWLLIPLEGSAPLRYHGSSSVCRTAK
ncbi:hypothetical protein T439DRAFT_356223 [Meredithblackwellia eburnea MCA 4105]